MRFARGEDPRRLYLYLWWRKERRSGTRNVLNRRKQREIATLLSRRGTMWGRVCFVRRKKRWKGKRVYSGILEKRLANR